MMAEKSFYFMVGFQIIVCLIFLTGSLAIFSHIVVSLGLDSTVSLGLTAKVFFIFWVFFCCVCIVASLAAFFPLLGDINVLNMPVVGVIAKYLQVAQTGVYWTDPHTGWLFTILQIIKPALNDFSGLCFPGTNQLSPDLVQLALEKILNGR